MLLVYPVLQELHAVLVLDLQVLFMGGGYVLELRSLEVPVDVEVARQLGEEELRFPSRIRPPANIAEVRPLTTPEVRSEWVLSQLKLSGGYGVRRGLVNQAHLGFKNPTVSSERCHQALSTSAELCPPDLPLRLSARKRVAAACWSHSVSRWIPFSHGA